MINYNLAQYSSYIIIETNKTRIEAIVEVNIQKSLKEDFICILKSNRDGIIELKPYEVVEFNWNIARRLYFDLKQDFDIKNAVVAIIYKSDFTRNLNLETFIDNLKDMSPLPYALIKFQKPKIIKTYEPRLPSVSLCAAFVYGTIPFELSNWLNYHLKLGISQIMIYDGTEAKQLVKYIKIHFGGDKRIEVVSYPHQTNSTKLQYCNEEHIDANLPIILKNYLRRLCSSFCENIFENKINKKFNDAHKKIAINDGFLVLNMNLLVIMILMNSFSRES